MDVDQELGLIRSRGIGRYIRRKRRLAKAANLRQIYRRMRPKHRKRTILLALTSTHHGFYRGAARYAAEHDWHVVADMIYDATIPVGWIGDGILSFVGPWEELARYVVSAGVPAVEISVQNICLKEISGTLSGLPSATTRSTRSDSKDLPLRCGQPDLTVCNCFRSTRGRAPG
jgi:hypothetical protein